ncbi:hypothetical protein [Halomicrobium urmianum]|uniref:hypothetical protein n=1 Tax=Halomicrobium urmianum TaxID=1586233 RepID=UPI001CD9393C|nr:hypothetical protein [Halomicrobium urmianum]
MPLLALHSPLPSRNRVVSRLLQAAAVAATLAVLSDSLRSAALSAAGFLALLLAGDVAEAVVGDYADHVLLGALTLGFIGFVAAGAGAVWFVAGGGFVGGWLLLDGVQHLRHGVTRDEVTVAYEHEGGVLTGIARALVERLLAPIRLES